MLIICRLSCSDCSAPFKITHLCYNDPMEIIVSITLVNSLDLAYCVAWAVLLSVLKHNYYFPDGGSFNGVVWVEVLCWNWHGLTSSWTWSILLLLSRNSVVLWLSFMMRSKYCESSSFFTSVSTLFYDGYVWYGRRPNDINYRGTTTTSANILWWGHRAW